MSLKHRLPVAVLAAALFAPTAPASHITQFSTGDGMVGGTLTVTFLISGAFTFPIVSGGPGTASVFVPGLVSFIVSGDTGSNNWSLTNLTATDLLLSSTFDLFFATALFDATNPNPGTFDSGAGLSGVLVVGGPAVAFASFEALAWADSENAGDLFYQEVINWNGFVPGATALWVDDTDDIFVVPEPSAAWLVPGAFALLAAARRTLPPRRPVLQ